MTDTTRRPESTGSTPRLLVALELSQRRWKLGMTSEATTAVRTRTMEAGAWRAFAEEVARAKRRLGLPATAAVVTCYEAGRDGFWIHRALARQGIVNLVLDASSIEVPRRRRRVKTDRLDAIKLAHLLRREVGGERCCRVVQVPSEAAEDARRAVRERRALVKSRTRVTNQIKSALATVGTPTGSVRTLGARLTTLTQWDGAPLPAQLVRWLGDWVAQWTLCDQQLQALRQQRRAIASDAAAAADQVARLETLRGIGPTTSDTLVYEAFAWRAFRNGRQVGAVMGLTGTPADSGDHRREQGISKAGVPALRHVAIEAAWSWLRYQPRSELSQWYHRRFAHAGPRARRIGIVALARKLVIALWRYATTGVVPAGAVLRAA
jgi:transposase